MFRKQRTSQPASRTGVDWGNPLTCGLLRIYDLSREGPGIDVLYNTIPATENVTTTFGHKGKAKAVTTSTYVSWSDDTYRTAITNQLTWFWHGKITTSGNGFICGNGQASGLGYNHMLYVGAAGSPIFFVKVGGTGFSIAGSTTINLVTGEYTIVGTYDGQNMRIYFAGRLEGTLARTGNVDTTDFETTLNRWNSASAQTGYCYQFGVANRAWTPAEVLSFELNPWQMFASTDRILSDAVAGGAITGSLSTSIGNVTLSSSGALAIAGDLSASIGSVTLSSTGALAITGQLSSSIGDITLSADGTIGDGISGQLNTSIGAVTLSSASALAIVGSLSASIGNITLSSAGTMGTGSSVWDEVIADGFTARQLFTLWAAILTGKVSGAGTGTEIFRAIDDSKDRVTATVDANGNRTAITLDAS